MNHCLLFSIRHEGSRAAGVYRIAHYLREYDWDAEVIDFTNYWTLIELKYLAITRITPNTKFIGFSHLFSYWPEKFEEFTCWLKLKYPWVDIISGSNVLPSFDSNAIDYYVQGFGENALMMLLKYLYSNGEKPNFTDFRGKKVIEANKLYPSFPMKSLMVKYEDRDFIHQEEWLATETARGCKFSCDFCNFPVLGVKGDYSRDADDFREQLVDAYDRFGVTRYSLGDETFNDRVEKITKFADVVESLNFRPEFTAYIRADLLISRPMDRIELTRMNLSGHYYGIESFNQLASRSIGKGLSSNKIKQGLVDVRNYFEKNMGDNYTGCISLISGLPKESIDSLRETQQWLSNNWQGQSFSAFYLRIFTGDADKMSKISANYSEYGYRELTDEEIKERSKNTEIEVFLKSDEHSQLCYKDGLHPSQELLWKNDQMDIFDAYLLDREFNKIRFTENYKIDPFDRGFEVIRNLKVNGMNFVDYYKKMKLDM